MEVYMNFWYHRNHFALLNLVYDANMLKGFIFPIE
jgi:hypothetical protein